MGADTTCQKVPAGDLRRQAETAATVAAGLLGRADGPFAGFRRAMARTALAAGWEALDELPEATAPVAQCELWPEPRPTQSPAPGLGKSRTCESTPGRPDCPDAGPCTSTAGEPITYTDRRAADRTVERYRFADGLRPLQEKWPSRCLRYRTEPGVQLQRDDGGRIRVAGVHSCGSIWACPICAPRIYAQRAGEVTAMLGRRKQGHKGYLLTLTVRHREGERWNCKKTHDGIARAWRWFWNGGRDAVLMRRSLKVEHYVRGLETTHGPHGWHPHYHVLMVLRADTPLWLASAMAERWQKAVRLKMGAQYEPDLEHGLTLKPSNAANYIAKLGLEVSSILSKTPRADGHRTTWQIGQAAAAGDTRSRLLWIEYTRAVKGHRQMTWSRHTKAEFHIAEVSDEQAARAAIVPSSVLDVPGPDWDTVVWAGLVAEALGRCAEEGLHWWSVYLLRAQPVAAERRAKWLDAREVRRKREAAEWYEAHARDLAEDEEAAEREAIQLAELRDDSERWARQVRAWKAGDLDDFPPADHSDVEVERYNPLAAEPPEPWHVVGSRVRGGPRGTRYRIEGGTSGT